MKTITLQNEAFDRFDVAFNECSVAELFQYYEDIGFIYPSKKEVLAPYFEKIKSNWAKLKTSEDGLLWIFNNKKNPNENFASVSTWKQSNYGMMAQHLVSNGNPFLSLKVMMAAQYKAEHFHDENQIRSSQNWFRPDNRYAYRVFASMFEKLGDEKASLIRFEYLHKPLKQIQNCSKKPFKIEEVTGIDFECIDFVSRQYGNVFVRAEELDQIDIQLRKIAFQYNKYGLKKSRKVFKIKDIQNNKTVACIVANRGPIGLNFSFFENRAYYILDNNLSKSQRTELLPVMNSALKPFYSGFEFQKIPIATDELTSEILQTQGATFFKTYMQSIWMREGFAQWYEHIHSFLERIERRMNKKRAA